MVFAFFILLAVLVWGIGNAIVKGIDMVLIPDTLNKTAIPDEILPKELLKENKTVP